jgi:hypothetical protein
MWFKKYPRPPNHGYLTLIEIHIENGIPKIHVQKFLAT